MATVALWCVGWYHLHHVTFFLSSISDVSGNRGKDPQLWWHDHCSYYHTALSLWLGDSSSGRPRLRAFHFHHPSLCGYCDFPFRRNDDVYACHRTGDCDDAVRSHIHCTGVVCGYCVLFWNCGCLCVCKKTSLCVLFRCGCKCFVGGGVGTVALVLRCSPSGAEDSSASD